MFVKDDLFKVNKDSNIHQQESINNDGWMDKQTQFFGQEIGLCESTWVSTMLLGPMEGTGLISSNTGSSSWYRQIDIQIDRQIDRQKDRQIDRQIDSQIDVL